MTADGDISGTAAGPEVSRAFYRQHHPQLLRSVTRRVGCIEEAEEVCQEIWKAFFLNPARFAAYDQPAKGLYAIARHRIVDYWRRRRRTPDLLVPTELEDLADAAGLVDGVVRTTDLRRALVALPPRQCEALTLHYLDQLTVAETAAAMGIGTNGVKKLLTKGLSALRASEILRPYRPAAQEVSR